MISIPNRRPGHRVRSEAAKDYESWVKRRIYVALSTPLRTARGSIGSSRFGLLGY